MPILAAIPFPQIDPIAFSLGPVAVRWYALAYILGLLLAVWYAKRIVRNASLWPEGRPSATTEQIDDLLLWATLGVVVGGRLGYVLFYNPAYFAANPTAIFQVWSGGMSFHGGFLGVVVACFLFGRKHGIGLDQLLDLAAAGVPIGLGLGRLANFINGELFGRTSDVSWAMVFPHGGPEPRHPSQLYEAALEGLVLFLILFWIARRPRVQENAGRIGGLFLIGYGLARSFVELFRELDEHLGLLLGGSVTMGQILSLPMILVGLALLAKSYAGTKHPRTEAS